MQIAQSFVLCSGFTQFLAVSFFHFSTSPLCVFCNRRSTNFLSQWWFLSSNMESGGGDRDEEISVDAATRTHRSHNGECIPRGRLQSGTDNVSSHEASSWTDRQTNRQTVRERERERERQRKRLTSSTWEVERTWREHRDADQIFFHQLTTDYLCSEISRTYLCRWTLWSWTTKKQQRRRIRWSSSNTKDCLTTDWREFHYAHQSFTMLHQHFLRLDWMIRTKVNSRLGQNTQRN